MEEPFIADDQATLFDVEGQLAEEDLQFLEELVSGGTTDRTMATIGMPFRSRNFVSIGVPEVKSLSQLFKKNNNSLPAEIQLQTKSYEFYQVQLTCSFHPAAGCRFHDARFALNLETIPDNPNSSGQAITDYAI